MSTFRITIEPLSDAERLVTQDGPLHLLYEALAEAEVEGLKLTDSVEPGGYDGFIEIELQDAPEFQGAVEKLIVKVCKENNLGAQFSVAGA